MIDKNSPWVKIKESIEETSYDSPSRADYIEYHTRVAAREYAIKFELLFKVGDEFQLENDYKLTIIARGTKENDDLYLLEASWPTDLSWMSAAEITDRVLYGKGFSKWEFIPVEL